VRIPLSGGDLNICSGDKSYTFGGHTYVPAAIGGIDSINENMDRGVEQSVLTLGGCDATLIAAVQVADFHWTQIQIYLGYLDANHDLVTTPYKVTDGFLGAPTISPSEKTSTISISIETLNAVMSRTSQVRACDADQKARGYSTDTFFHQCGLNGTRQVAFGNGKHDGLGRHDTDGTGGAGTGKGPGSPPVPGVWFPGGPTGPLPQPTVPV
jgi:hypothetical protein